jgi:hypothetical protein
MGQSKYFLFTFCAVKWAFRPANVRVCQENLPLLGLWTHLVAFIHCKYVDKIKHKAAISALAFSGGVAAKSR